MSRPLSIWLVTVGEPLPLPGSTDRMWRTGLLAEILARRGHRPLWWTSTVDHFRKVHFVADEQRVATTIGVPVQFLGGSLYRRNVSLQRLRNHAQIASRFAALVAHEDRPDVILCSFPTIELSREAVRYGAAARVPVIIDVRDLWPDAFIDLVPRAARRVARWALRTQFKDTEAVFRDCAAIYGVSRAYLEWGLAKGGRARRDSDAEFPLGYRRTQWSRADEEGVDAKLRAAGADGSRPLATFVGTFGRTYDLGTVIAAARTLAAERFGPQFVLCGAGEREQEWRTAAAELDNVAFTGWLSAGELACLLARSAVGLAAYAAEAPQGIPNKVIEYLSAGLPMVCSLPGESRALLEGADCGIYYEPGDAAALRRALLALLEDEPGRRAMGLRAARLFERHYSSDTVYGAMADAIESVARRP
jgi:glycosyltransferase involved in cell wall biosynthesis